MFWRSIDIWMWPPTQHGYWCINSRDRNLPRLKPKTLWVFIQLLFHCGIRYLVLLGGVWRCGIQFKYFVLVSLHDLVPATRRCMFHNDWYRVLPLHCFLSCNFDDVCPWLILLLQLVVANSAISLTLPQYLSMCPRLFECKEARWHRSLPDVSRNNSSITSVSNSVHLLDADCYNNSRVEVWHFHFKRGCMGVLGQLDILAGESRGKYGFLFHVFCDTSKPWYLRYDVVLRR